MCSRLRTVGTDCRIAEKGNCIVKTLYIDCQAGIAGDMFVAALLDLGVPEQTLREALDSLHIDDFRVEITKKQTHGIVGTDYNVILTSASSDGHEHGHPHLHRNLQDVEALLDTSGLNDAVRSLSKRIFGYVARAEAKVHGLPLEQVHFHEVGAADSIADIVGAAICVDALNVDDILFSPLTEGTGFVRCAHGLLPVPAPATAEIMRIAHIPYRTMDVDGEMVTPTGAAITAGLARTFCPMPLMQVDRVGYGCGKREFPHASVVRAFLGETQPVKPDAY